MIRCQRIPLTEVRDIFIFPHLFMSVHYALSYQYFQFMYITCIYLSYHCFWMVYCTFWVFVCVCCAAPDKLTSPPPFTGFGALHYPRYIRSPLLVLGKFMLSVQDDWVACFLPLGKS